jgi:hypothetical protein
MEERKSDLGSDDEDNKGYEETSQQDTPAGLIDNSNEQLLRMNLGLLENKKSSPLKVPDEDENEDEEVNSEKGGSDNEIDRNKQSKLKNCKTHRF